MKTPEETLPETPQTVKLSPLNIEIFWKKSGKRGPDECWNWNGGTMGEMGYGRISVGDKSRKAHRISWVIHYGQIPEGRSVLHRCDNPLCVNPAHLFLGTHDDNMADKVSKNRQARNKGESAGGVKFTEEKILEIRKLHSTLGIQQKELAKMLGINKGTLNNIILRKTWRHI